MEEMDTLVEIKDLHTTSTLRKESPAPLMALT